MLHLRIGAGEKGSTSFIFNSLDLLSHSLVSREQTRAPAAFGRVKALYVPKCSDIITAEST